MDGLCQESNEKKYLAAKMAPKIRGINKILCKECRRASFVHFKNFRAHVKQKHPEKIDILAPTKKKPVEQSKVCHKCTQCSATFLYMKNLRAHMKQKHPGKIDTLAPNTKKNKGSNICNECGAAYAQLKYLKAHIKQKHPEKKYLLAPKMKNVGRRGSNVCNECNNTYMHFQSLRAHVKKHHLGKLRELAPLRKKIYVCSQCNAEFNTHKKLTLHQKTHNIKRAVRLQKCPMCQFTASMINLRSHFRVRHSIRIESEVIEFESFEAFQSWKVEVEKKTFASFVQYGKKNERRVRYVCHRSGYIRTRGNNVRATKSQGLNKINAYCPAEMRVFFKEDKYVVKFCKSHIGHKQEEDMGHLFLTLADRQNIAAKIAAKIPLQVILDEVRDSVSNCRLDRLNLLKKRDLYNIKKSFNLTKSSVRHMNDAIKQNPNCVPQKPQELLSDDSIVELDENTDDFTNLIGAASTTKTVALGNTLQEVCEKRRAIIQSFEEDLRNATSIKELEAVENIIAFVRPTLQAIKNE